MPMGPESWRGDMRRVSILPTMSSRTRQFRHCHGEKLSAPAPRAIGGRPFQRETSKPQSPTLFTHYLTEDGLNRDLRFFPGTNKIQYYRLAIPRLDSISDGRKVVYLVSINSHDLVAGFQSGLTSGESRLNIIENAGGRGIPSGVAHVIGTLGDGGNGRFHDFASALNFQGDGFIRR
jgi:hypothetical protein